ncbi:MAG: ion channel [Candidatus Woesearchaeota archaeon]
MVNDKLKSIKDYFIGFGIVGIYFLIIVLSKIFWDVIYGLILGTLIFVVLLLTHFIISFKRGKDSISDFTINMLAAIIGFNFIIAFIYFVMPIDYGYLQYSNSTIIQPKSDYFTDLYFSGVVFTTLGFGDIHPKGILRFIATIEALMGWIVLALLIFGINKYVEPKNLKNQKLYK